MEFPVAFTIAALIASPVVTGLIAVFYNVKSKGISEERARSGDLLMNDIKDKQDDVLGKVEEYTTETKLLVQRVESLEKAVNNGLTTKIDKFGTLCIKNATKIEALEKRR